VTESVEGAAAFAGFGGGAGALLCYVARHITEIMWRW